MSAATRTVYIVPHTHWDREWYEPFETFRTQLVALWDQLLALTEADPDFRFLMDGQSVVIDDYLEIRPEARARLERAVRNGQVQVGPWYTLPDEFLVTGETLVRNLQRGLASATAHGGSMRVGYLPDSFGHAAQMPQIYKQLGFRYAAIWRGVPLAIDRVAFTWEAPDGSQVLTAYMGNSYAQGVDLPTEPDALMARIACALKAIEPFQPTNDILLMNGNDHVLPQRALSDAVRQASGHANGTLLRLARLDEYLAVLPEDSWPHWKGELRSSARANVLMGTLSVRVPDKQRYATATRTLERLAEPLAALSGADCTAQLAEAWTLILQNAAHDTACGSGIDAVSDAAVRRSQRAQELSDEVIARGLPMIAAEGELWNPSPFPRAGVVDIDGAPVLTASIPGCAAGKLVRAQAAMPVMTAARRLENVFLLVELNEDGTFDVRDKENDVHYAGLNRLVDEADAGDEYNFSPPPQADAVVLTDTKGATWTVAEQHSARGRVGLNFAMAIRRGLQADRRGRVSETIQIPVRLVLSLEADARRLDVDLEVQNRATDHRLRAHFPLPFQATHSHADTPFHVTPRPVVAPHRDPGAPEVQLPAYPMRSFVDVADGRRGMALITDGLHEYEVLAGEPHVLALTLLRAVGWLSREDLSMRTGHAGPALETPGAQVQGSLRFNYRLMFHSGDWQDGAVWRAAESALLPLQVGSGRPSAASSVRAGIELEPASLQMTACIPGTSGFDLRLLNAGERAIDAAVSLRPTPRRARLLTLGDSLRQELLPSNRLTFALRPWEIATLRIDR